MLHIIDTNVPFFGGNSNLTLLMPFEMYLDYDVIDATRIFAGLCKMCSNWWLKWQYHVAHYMMQFDRIAKIIGTSFKLFSLYRETAQMIAYS